MFPLRKDRNRSQKSFRGADAEMSAHWHRNSVWCHVSAGTIEAPIDKAKEMVLAEIEKML